jgi:hypothetical protein
VSFYYLDLEKLNKKIVPTKLSNVFGEKPWSSAVFFNLFDVAEPKMTSKNFTEPNLPSNFFCGTPYVDK